MQVTIVGLPGSGKTTVFNALTGAQADTGGFSGGRAAPNMGVVKVPDVRLDRLTELFHPRKTIPADVTYVGHHLVFPRFPRQRELVYKFARWLGRELDLVIELD